MKLLVGSHISSQTKHEPSRDNHVLPYIIIPSVGQSPPFTLGRIMLLQTLWKACGCATATTRRGTTTAKCGMCRCVTDWAKRMLPRSFLRLETDKNNTCLLWVLNDTKYPRSCIQVGKSQKSRNGQKEYVFTTIDEDLASSADDASWAGPVPLADSDCLRFHSHAHHHPSPPSCLTFRLVRLNHLVEGEDVSSTPVTSPTRPSSSDQQCACSTPDSIPFCESADTYEVNQCLSARQSLSPNCLLALKRGTSTLPGGNRKRAKRVNRMQSMVAPICSLEVQRTDKDSAESTPDFSVMTTPVKYISTKAKYRLYFVQYGTDMAKVHIKGKMGSEGLEHHVQKRGAVVLSEFDRNNPPTHFVVSNSAPSPEAIANALGFRSKKAMTDEEANSEAVDKLQRFMYDHDIVCVFRKWAERGNGKDVTPAPLMAPTMSERYLRLHPRRGSDWKKPACINSYEVSKRRTTPTGQRNKALSDYFFKLSKLYQECPLEPADNWRAYTFNIVSGRLRYLDFDVSDDPDSLRRLKALKHFGRSTMEEVYLYLKKDDGIPNRLNTLQTNVKRQAMQRLMNIWGFGQSTAKKFVDCEYTTPAQVREAFEKGLISIDRNQYIGLLCYEDFLEKMSREEVEAIFDIVRVAIDTELPGAEIVTMGSYRRGKTTCGDIDIMITHPSYKTGREIPRESLGRVVDSLAQEGHMAYHLTKIPGMDPAKYETLPESLPNQLWTHLKNPPSYSSQSSHSKVSNTSYMGVFNSPIVPGRKRRIDIKLYPYCERVFASLHFTGNGYFNRAMRLWAKRKFMYQLSEHGLFERGTHKLLLEPTCERDIFDALGLVYREPWERDCFDAVKGKKEGEYALNLSPLSRFDLIKDMEQHSWVD